MAVYKAKFKLTNPVIDIEEARKYLEQNDITRYMQYANYISNDTYREIDKLEIKLKTNKSGYVKMTTKSELSEKELDIISDWLKEQLIGDIGDSFSNEDFANYDATEYQDLIRAENGNLEQGFIRAEFDMDNEYIFEFVS